MRLLKKWMAVALVGLLLFAATGCGKKGDSPEVGVPPSAGDQAAVEACAAANRLMLGDGLSVRGHKLIFKGVPLSVREPELLAALPDKELLRLAVKRGTLPKEADLYDVLDLSSNEGDSAARILTINRLLQNQIATQTAEDWQKKSSLWARIWRKSKSPDEWQAYLDQQKEKNKTTITLER